METPKKPFENITLSFNCPKQLNDMQPCNSGWYCNGCHKMVHDFRGFSETQLMDKLISDGEKLCGVYTADQIKITQRQPKWAKWVSATLMILGLTTLHEHLLAQDKPVEQTNEMTPASANILLGKTILMGEPMITQAAPQFPGGLIQLQQYLKNHLTHIKNLSGTAKAKIVLAPDGTVTDIVLLNNINKPFDDSFIRALKASPKWVWIGESYRTLTAIVSVNLSEMHH